jgi:hypothetical protein
MSKKWQYIIILSGLLLFMLWILNPTSGSFATYIKKNRQIDPTIELNYVPGRELVEQKIQDQLGKGLLDYDLERRIIYSYKSYLFFSKAMFIEDRDPSILEIRHYYIGLFENFIPIGTEIPNYGSPKGNSDTYLPHPSDSTTDEEVQGWKYNNNADKQTGGNIHSASIESKKLIILRPKHTEGSGTLIIREMRGRSQVFLSLNEGQFISEIPSLGINVSFDNGKIETWSCDTIEGTTNSAIIVLSSLKFISTIKMAKNLRIDANIYNKGLQTLEFDVDGLEWEQNK